MIRVLFAALFALGPQVVWGAKTEPGQETIWDQIMAAQAIRNLQEGGHLMQQGSYQEAVREFARAVTAQPKEPWGHVMLGAAYYWSGQVDLAMKEYQEAISLDPKNSQAHQLMGIAYAWKGDSERSLREFLEAERLSPERADIVMDAGSVYESLGNISKALEYFRRAVHLDAVHPLYHFQLGLLYSRLGRDSDALDSFQAALKHFSQYEDALLEIGALWERGGDLDRAIEYFQKAVRMKPRDSVARFRLGYAYLKKGKSDRAAQVFEEAFRLSPEGEEGQLGLSMAYKKKQGNAQNSESEDPAGPAEAFRRNLERIPLNREAKVEVDLAYMPRPELVPVRSQESRLKNALESSQKLPQIPSAMGVRRQFSIPAETAGSREKRIEAIMKELDSVRKGAPPHSDVRMSMNLQMGRAVEGRSGVSYQPRDVGNDLGLWVMGTGWMDLVHEVLPELQGSFQERGSAKSAEWYLALGLGQILLGDSDSAREAFSGAISRDAHSWRAYLGQGVAYLIDGDEEKALESYKKVLEINPKSKGAKQNLKWLGTKSAIRNPQSAIRDKK
ncbi:MAG: tetratricopeptide repeat protein [Elusimicrobia bacterium]|nr:tetratricopeptide repeat protein [Elusimicrobiota bacterium]